jgi:uncharacterized membrane protein
VAPGVFVHVLFRFFHTASVILLLGGVVYARLVLTPTLNSLPDDIRKRLARDAQERYRVTLFALLILIVGSGLYNFFTGPKHGQSYQIWFGIKMLLVAHIVASAILWATSSYGDVTIDGRSKRRLVSIAISGMIVVFISAYLRSLTQRGL